MTQVFCDLDSDVDAFLGVETDEAKEILQGDKDLLGAEHGRFHTPTLEELREYFRSNPEEMQRNQTADFARDKFQGDILATVEEIKQLYGSEVAQKAKAAGETMPSSPLLRGLGAVTSNVLTFWWGGILLYEWHPSAYDKINIRMYLTAAMAEITAKTDGIIRFRYKTSGTRVIYKSEDGCFSQVGAMGWIWGQTLSLADSCASKRTAIHELLHALGMHHQHSIHNRDDFVTILWDNIFDDMEFNFRKELFTTTFGQHYDYDSIMHYPEYTRNTEVAIDTSKKILDAHGHRVGVGGSMSKQDISELILMYKCPTRQVFSTVARYNNCRCERGLKKRYIGPFNGQAVCNYAVLYCPRVGTSSFATTGIFHGCICPSSQRKVYTDAFKSRARCEPRVKWCPNGSFSTTGYWNGCLCNSTHKKVYLDIFKARARCERKYKVCPNGNFATTGYWRGCHCCCRRRKYYSWFKSRAQCK